MDQKCKLFSTTKDWPMRKLALGPIGLDPSLECSQETQCEANTQVESLFEG